MERLVLQDNIEFTLLLILQYYAIWLNSNLYALDILINYQPVNDSPLPQYINLIINNSIINQINFSRILNQALDSIFTVKVCRTHVCGRKWMEIIERISNMNRDRHKLWKIDNVPILSIQNCNFYKLYFYIPECTWWHSLHIIAILWLQNINVR